MVFKDTPSVLQIEEKGENTRRTGSTLALPPSLVVSRTKALLACSLNSQRAEAQFLHGCFQLPSTNLKSQLVHKSQTASTIT